MSLLDFSGGTLSLYVDNEVLRWLYGSDLSLREKSLFMVVMTLRPKSLAELTTKSGMGRGRAASTCRVLVRRDWLRLVDSGKELRPVPWIPRNYQEMQATRLVEEYDMAPLKAEFLLRKILRFLVDRDHHLYNVRPKYLTNPQTGKRLEFDCLIDEDAWEHNGEQHYEITEEYASVTDLHGTQARDLMKESLGTRNGIRLHIVTSQDLSIEGIRKTIPPDVPVHLADLEGPHAKAIESLCTAYRRRQARATAQRAAAQRARQRGEGVDAVTDEAAGEASEAPNQIDRAATSCDAGSPSVLQMV